MIHFIQFIKNCAPFIYHKLIYKLWIKLNHISSIQFSHSVVLNSLRPHEPQHTRLPCPSPTPGVTQTHVLESVMPSNCLILCHPLLLLPSICPRIRNFSNDSALHIRWPKYWSFSFNISPVPYVRKQAKMVTSFRHTHSELWFRREKRWRSYRYW